MKALIITASSYVVAYLFYTKIHNYQEAAIAATAGTLALAYFINKVRYPTRTTTHGSAAFANDKETREWRKPTNEPLAPGALILGPYGSRHRLVLPASMAFRHLLICAPPGAGKSRGFLLPNARHYNGSYVVSDNKNEIWETVSAYRADARRYSPRDPDASHPFNFVTLCTDHRTTRVIAEAIIRSSSTGKSDVFFENAEINLMIGLLAHAATFEQCTPAALYDFITHPSHTGDDLMSALINSPSKIARDAATIFKQTDKKLRGGIIAGIVPKIDWLADEQIRRFTSASRKSPDFGALRGKQISVFWNVSESDVSALQSLSCLFFTLVLHQIKNGEGDQPVCLMLDEFPAAGRISRFEFEIPVLRGRMISCLIAAQTTSQIYYLYGERGGQVIMDNCNTKIVLAGVDTDTAEKISRSIGETTIFEERKSISSSGKGQHSTTSSIVAFQRRLVFANEVQQIQADQQFILSSNRKPILWKRYHYDDIPCAAPTRRLRPTRTMNFDTPPQATSVDTSPPPAG
jgi:type IV secretion system protein VirD4